MAAPFPTRCLTLLAVAASLTAGCAAGQVPSPLTPVARGPVTHVTQIAFGIDSADGRWALHRYVAPDEDFFLLSYGAPGLPDTARVKGTQLSGGELPSLTAFSYHGDRLAAVAKTTDGTPRASVRYAYDGNLLTATREDGEGKTNSETRSRFKAGKPASVTTLMDGPWADSVAYAFTATGGTETRYRPTSEADDWRRPTWSARPERVTRWTENEHGDRILEIVDDLGDEPYLDDTLSHAYRYDARGNFTEYVRREDGEPDYLRLRRLHYDEIPADSLRDYYLVARDLADGHWEGVGQAAGRFLSFSLLDDDSLQVRHELLPRVMTGYVDPADSTAAFFSPEPYFVTVPGEALVLLGRFGRGPAEVMRYRVSGDRLTVAWGSPAGPAAVTLTYRRIPEPPVSLLDYYGLER